MGCWSDLVNDVLEHLTGLLSFPDQHRFSAVCHNWRLVAKQKRCCPPKPQLPWLVLGEDKITKKRNFFNLSEQRHYSIDIPELYGQFICGSSHGWLITVDIRINGRLVNPFTRDCIHLPPLPPYDSINNVTTYTDEPVYDSDGKLITYSFKEMQKKLVLKAILSHDPREKSDNFIVMILFGGPHRVAIWRPSDTDWTVINSLWGSMADIFYFEGQLYVVQLGFQTFYVIDMGYQSEKKLTVKRIDTHYLIGAGKKYLVVFEGKLLILSRFEKGKTRRTKKFAVQALEMNWWEVEAPEKTYFLVDKEIWCEMRDINGHAVFIGNNASIFVNPTEFPTEGCITNGIYFSDMAPNYYWEHYGHDFGVYDMDKDTIGQFCSTSSDDDVFLPPDAIMTWFIPSLDPW